jgi:hypothetical protein
MHRVMLQLAANPSSGGWCLAIVDGFMANPVSMVPPRSEHGHHGARSGPACAHSASPSVGRNEIENNGVTLVVTW